MKHGDFNSSDGALIALTPLIRKLAAASEAEERLLDLLADAVNRDNRDDVFLLASQLTKAFIAAPSHAHNKVKEPLEMEETSQQSNQTRKGNEFYEN